MSKMITHILERLFVQKAKDTWDTASITPPTQHSGTRISAYSKATVFADSGRAVEKNGALQCVVSAANPHDILTIIA